MKSHLALIITFVCTATAYAVTVDTVRVGNPGNLSDPSDGDRTATGVQHFGSVPYVYNIGKYEITAGQYTEFLNAVAKDDPNGLYNPYMANATAKGANILQTGASPNLVYSVAPDWVDRPVNFVGLWDAARFANWLHNGQPVGPQGPGTTEDGAYVGIGNNLIFHRNADARFFIPTNNEWYKAAFHKNDGLTANYWKYPTSSNTAPGNTLPDPGNHANINIPIPITGVSVLTIGAPYYRTTVGVFINSASPYGTFDQGGNVEEWLEDIRDSVYSYKRSGDWAGYSSGIDASAYAFNYPWDEDNSTGFRIASAAVPEPSAAFLVLSAFTVLATGRRKSVPHNRV